MGVERYVCSRNMVLGVVGGMVTAGFAAATPLTVTNYKSPY
jgi:hypothetical protein